MKGPDGRRGWQRLDCGCEVWPRVRFALPASSWASWMSRALYRRRRWLNYQCAEHRAMDQRCPASDVWRGDARVRSGA